MTKAEVSKLLRTARDLMNRNGDHWIQGTLTKRWKRKNERVEASYCSIGGINKAAGVAQRGMPTERTRPALYALANQILIERRLQPRFFNYTDDNDRAVASTIIGFNDTGTWLKVKRAFTNAARKPVIPE